MTRAQTRRAFIGRVGSFGLAAVGLAAFGPSAAEPQVSADESGQGRP